MGSQLPLFEEIERVLWRQLPEEEREAVCELLAKLLVRRLESGASEEVGGDR